jgi:tryptophan halogenase
LSRSINKIAVVGGGSAGWLSATYLARHFNSTQPGAVQVTLIESEDVGTIGVGEGTMPSIRKMLKFLGIEERVFMKATTATFKQAIRFDDWLHLPTENNRSSYYHTFQVPVAVKGESIAPYWIMSREENGKNYVDYGTSQGKVCDARLGPYIPGIPPRPSDLNYAYHLDAGKFGEFLKDLGIEYGVRHRIGHVTNVVMTDGGHIDYLEVRDQEALDADLFIDCTGFAAFLIEKKLGSPFLDQSSMIFCDRAIAIQVPYEHPDASVRPYTLSTAKPHGWIWDIGLSHRRGIGYVYSSKYTEESDALDVLMDYVGPAGSELSTRTLPMRVGYRETPWVNNCISIGLSAGFIEPLEATGIHHVEVSLNRIAKIISRNGNLEYMSRQFNKSMTEWFELVFDFIKMHYCVCRRDDTEFWIDNRDPNSISDRLNHQLEMWRTRPTNETDLGQRRPTFGHASYHQVLFGLDHIPDLTGEEFIYPFRKVAEIRSSQIKDRTARELESLPSHRDLLNSIYASAMNGGPQQPGRN